MTPETPIPLDEDWSASAKLALRILQESDRPLDAREVAQRSSLPMSTSRRVLRELRRAGEVEVVLDVDNLRRRPFRPAGEG